MTVLAVIPCRYGAARFPGKPLADIHGKPMMWHVHQRTKMAELVDDIVIATDDSRIEDACNALGMKVIMTSAQHATGTDRVAEVASRLDASIYVNVQGDEPMINPEAIDIVIDAIRTADEATVASNAFNDLHEPSHVVDTNVVKVITTLSGAAMAFSRIPIPYPKGDTVHYKRQLGLYAFRRRALELFASLNLGPVERAESVEMLRFVEAGHRVQMVRVPNDDAIPVDTPENLAQVRLLMGRGS